MSDALDTILQRFSRELDAPLPEHIQSLVDRSMDICRHQRDAEIGTVLPELTSSIVRMAAARGTYRITADTDVTFITSPITEDGTVSATGD